MKAVKWYHTFGFLLVLGILGFLYACEFIPGFVMDGDKPNPTFLAPVWAKAASVTFGFASIVFIILWSRDTFSFSKTNDNKNTDAYLVGVGLCWLLAIVSVFL